MRKRKWVFFEEKCQIMPGLKLKVGIFWIKTLNNARFEREDIPPTDGKTRPIHEELGEGKYIKQNR